MKDFVEKRLVFSNDEVIYCYYSTSSLQDAEFSQEKGIERAETIYGVQKIYRDPDGDRAIVFESAAKCDIKLSISNAVLKTLVPAAIKDWSVKL